MLEGDSLSKVEEGEIKKFNKIEKTRKRNTLVVLRVF
jgi:hypothetical protein